METLLALVVIAGLVLSPPTAIWLSGVHVVVTNVVK